MDSFVNIIAGIAGILAGIAGILPVQQFMDSAALLPMHQLAFFARPTREIGPAQIPRG